MATQQIYEVIHPLFDRPEEKRSAEGLGKMKMSRSVRLSLMLLRGYFVVMLVLLAYNMLDRAGFFRR